MDEKEFWPFGSREDALAHHLYHAVLYVDATRRYRQEVHFSTGDGVQCVWNVEASRRLLQMPLAAQVSAYECEVYS